MNSDQGYLLHCRPFRDTSLLADFYLQHHGLVRLLFKGVRQGGKSGAKGRMLQPFGQLYVTFTGRTELKTGAQLEVAQPAVILQGRQLYCGLYLNELLTRTLLPEEPLPELLGHYADTLKRLTTEPLEPVLRQFEYRLLVELGYGIDFEFDAQGQAIEPQQHYWYIQESGFVPVNSTGTSHPSFSGEALLGMGAQQTGAQQYASPEVLAAAKQLHRLALAPLLGDRPLKSRELFLNQSH